MHSLSGNYESIEVTEAEVEFVRPLLEREGDS
jgi:hypothetical protein